MSAVARPGTTEWETRKREFEQAVPLFAEQARFADTDRTDGTLKVSRISSQGKGYSPALAGIFVSREGHGARGHRAGQEFAALNLVGRMTVGGPWPVSVADRRGTGIAVDRRGRCGRHDRPRLDLAHADCDKVEFIEGVHHIDPASGAYSLDLVSLIHDLPAIERKITELNAAALVIDPLTSFADSDTNKTSDMRRLLDGLAQIAALTAGHSRDYPHEQAQRLTQGHADIAGSHVSSPPFVWCWRWHATRLTNSAA